MKLKLLLLTVFFSALSWGQATIAIQDFESTPATPTWGYSGGGTVVTTANKHNGARSLQIGGTTTITFSNVDISSYTSVVLSVAFASVGADSGEDLFMDISYDNGLTWNGTGSVKLVDGFSNANININTTNALDPTTVPSNPYPTSIDSGEVQIAVRFRSVGLDSGEYYFIDDVKLEGVASTPNPPIITSSLTASANTGAAFTYDITATNAPTSYSASGLPAGLSINTTTGQITGSVAVAGTYNVTISATNTYGSDSETLVITITSGPCYSANAPTFSTSGSTSVGDVDSGGIPTNTIRLASGSSAGSITTTATGVAAGPVTLRFRAKGWSATETSVTVTLDGQTQNITNVPSAGFDWVELTFASVSANPTLVFSTVANKRVHIGNVEIYCGPITLADIVLHSNNPAVAASSITQAENNHVIYAFDLAVSSANATLNNVVFNTTGSYAASNITNFKLWYSTDATFDSTTDTFLDSETTGLGAGSHTFTGFTRIINSGTTGYFFITTDIPCAATVANDITVSAITTADLTFVSGNKSGTAFASGTHTIIGSTPNNVTGLATSSCENQQATVSWTAPAGCYDNVLVFVSDTPFTTAVPTGNGGAYTASTTFTSGASFDGGYTAYKGTGTSVTITGLTNGTTYYYKVFTRNGLLWSSGVSVSCTPIIAYCASGSTSTGDSEIENVVLNGENNSINNNTTDFCTTGVNDYTAMSADLAVGSSYTLTVEFGDCNNGSQYDGAGGVWIDWNNDGDFDDANETIGTANVAVSSGNVIENFTINVPAAQPLGFYRMRIVQEESGSAASISPCGTFSWGSTEDYTIEVINACVSTTSVSSIMPTSGPVGTVVTINGSGFTTATSVSFGSVAASFTVVSNTVIEVVVPTGATTGNITIYDTGGCNLSYSSFTVITKDNSSCEGIATTTDLIIYDIHDEYTGSGGFITFYNGTAATVNMVDYSIWRTSNYGDGNEIVYASLTGTIASGALGVIKVSTATCGPAATNGTISGGFNEDDGIQLRNAAGTVVIDDVHTYAPSPGYYMVRNTGSLSARTTYVAADWSITPLGAGVCEPSAGLVVPVSNGESPTVTLNPVDVNTSCSSTSATLTVAGSEGVAGGAGLVYQWYVNVSGNAGWTALSDGGVYSGATSTALNISSTSGLNNYQYYCQIRENTVTCFTATEAAIIKDGATIWDGTAWSNGVPDLTKAAIINGDYNTASHGNIDACNLTVNTGFLAEVTAGAYFNIQNEVTVNGTLRVYNDGSLVQINDLAVNTGNISYERITTGTSLDYVYWSSPVDGVNAPNGYVYNWNPTIANTNGGLGNWVAAGGSSMTAGVGFIMRNVLSKTFTGVPRNGVISPTIARGSYQGADYAGTNGTTITRFDDNWNLVGNPYPSAISAEDFLLANTNIEGAVRLWTHATQPSTAIPNPFYGTFVANYTPNDYITHNGTGTVSGPAGFGGYIGGGQSFLVNMLDGTAASGNVTFNNALRSKAYDNSQFYRQAITNTNGHVVNGIEKNRIWLDIINSNNVSDRTLVGYVTGATEAKDRMYDAVTAVKTNMRIYSIIDQDKMTIQGRTVPFDAKDKVQMGYYAPANGTYSIAIAALDGLFQNGQDIYLEDTKLNVIHDLRQAPYSFYATVEEDNTRFILRYTANTNTLSIDEVLTNESNIIIASAETLNISSPVLAIQKVTIHNVLGQLLFNRPVNSTSLQVDGITKSNQTLIVEIVLENNERIVRKVIF
ncbi:GEVED domain-containing protein [Flavobacterium sp. U410]